MGNHVGCPKRVVQGAAENILDVDEPFDFAAADGYRAEAGVGRQNEADLRRAVLEAHEIHAARAAVERIIAEATAQCVVARPTNERVGAAEARETVIARAAVERVSHIVADQSVTGTAAGEDFEIGQPRETNRDPVIKQGRQNGARAVERHRHRLRRRQARIGNPVDVVAAIERINAE